MRNPISVNITDAHFGIWQDDAKDPSFNADIYGGLIKLLRGAGWSVRADPHTHKHYRILSPNQRLAARGTLRASISISGCHVAIDLWATTWPVDNRNGRRYDFNRTARMTPLDQKRVELLYQRLIAWLETLAPVSVKRNEWVSLTPMQRIAQRYAESWHSDKALGRPVCSYDYNRKSGDGHLLEHGQTVWFPDYKGRVCRGTAYYNINNMWWVVAGSELFNKGCFELLNSPPADLRAKLNKRDRRNKLERELAKATEQRNFTRMDVLKSIIFGGAETYMIWARDKQAYYRSQYAGYTSDKVHAGKYTREEAEKECKRVPHELEMVGPNGRHVSFDRIAA